MNALRINCFVSLPFWLAEAPVAPFCVVVVDAITGREECLFAAIEVPQ